MILSCAFGQDESDSIYYRQENGEIIITWYEGSAQSIIIPEKTNELLVTVIGDYAFQKNHLTSVTISDSVTELSSSAFDRGVQIIRK